MLNDDSSRAADPEPLLIEDDDGVRTITFNRPDALNAMTIPMWNGTRDALDSAEDDGIRCVVLTGSGRAFTVGQDLAEFSHPGHAEADGGFRGLMRALSEVPLPVLGAINGIGVGFGFTALAWCDVALVDPSARFKAPFVELGVVPEAGASVAFPEVMGPQAATWALLSGEWMSAEDAVRHGLALRVAAPSTVLEETHQMASLLASQPPRALRATLELSRTGRQRWRDALQPEYDWMAQLAGGEENIAAITAFFERG